ncbi:SulP family inorganic anion transporter [Humibacillus xanthopallidus]|uniref:High affinity sulfate transporter 1 n=1 Tax=Humibacillus xanthopallidus TaxID=412689 RepID=A0A543HI23_9MICO|nr:SulP family inorganic anion transporter [Humibacillus xanthopallidus]TQM57985.1 high affinity sulfate transporter 1 [Humibacillus xanthopallidus]
MALLTGYRRQWLRGDLVAGVTVAAIAIPESLGYASIAGLPVQTGLYCALLPAILFALIASTRQLVVGADSATAALVAAGAGAVVAAGSPTYASTVAVLGLITAAILLLMAIARLGFLADLISQPVLAGFLSGVGVSLIIGKLPGMLGITASGTTWDKLVATVTNLGHINVTSAALALGVVVSMLFMERVLPKLPAALLAVVVFSVVAALIGAEGRGVSMVGDVPAGLPSLTLPTFDAGELTRLTATAAAIAVVILAQSAAVARSFATKNGYRDNTNQDLYGLAAANTGSALTGGFAINGSPPRTSAGDGAGSRSQLVNITMALVIGIVLLFATGLFEYLPSPVLDGVVFAIGVGLVKVGQLQAVRRTRLFEFGAAMLALVVVAFVGVEQGILLAVLVSLVDRLRRQHQPHDEVLVSDGDVAPRLLGRVQPGTPMDGILVYRFGTGLFFENAAYFDERVRDLVAAATAPVQAVVLDAAAMDDIDFTGTEVLRRQATDFAARGIRVFLAELSTDAENIVLRAGLGKVLTVVPRLEQAIIAAS